jgi:hypothetical protein
LHGPGPIEGDKVVNDYHRMPGEISSNFDDLRGGQRFAGGSPGRFMSQL